VRGGGVIAGIDGGGGEAEARRRAGDADGDFAAIGDKKVGKGHLESQVAITAEGGAATIELVAGLWRLLFAAKLFLFAALPE